MIVVAELQKGRSANSLKSAESEGQPSQKFGNCYNLHQPKFTLHFNFYVYGKRRPFDALRPALETRQLSLDYLIASCDSFTFKIQILNLDQALQSRAKERSLSCEKVLPVCTWLVLSKTVHFFCTSL